MDIQIKFRASTQLSLGHLVRLACLRHAASVHPEPGSNSQKYIFYFIMFVIPSYSSNLDVLLSFQRSFSTCFTSDFCALFVKCVLNIPHPNNHVNNFFEFFSFFLFFFLKCCFLWFLCRKYTFF